MWDLPGSVIEPVSSALAGRFFTTEPPGKPCDTSLLDLVRKGSVLEKKRKLGQGGRWKLPLGGIQGVETS